MAIFQLKGDALNWWSDLEKQLHLSPLSVSGELFEERFNMKYLPAYYREQQAVEERRGRRYKEGDQMVQRGDFW